MQLEKSFYFKLYSKVIIALVLMVLGMQTLQAQVEVINHKLVKKETLYKLSVLYRTEIDSIMHWNNLSSTLLSQGVCIKILDYNKLKLEEFVYNQYVYDIEVKKAEKALLQRSFNTKFLLLETRKEALDDSKPQSMQEFFDIARIKKSYLDSLVSMNVELDKLISALNSEKAEVEEDIKRKYPKQYIDQGYTTILKDKENHIPTLNALAAAETNNATMVSNPVPVKDAKSIELQEELIKLAEQKSLLEQKQWEKDENGRLKQLAKELKKKDKKSKEEEKAKANELAALKVDNEAKAALDIKLKKEVAIANKNEQIKALQTKANSEAQDLAKQKKEAKTIAEEAQEAKQKEINQLAKEKSEAAQKAQVEMSEADLKIVQMKKELAAMEAAKAKKQKEWEQKEAILDNKEQLVKPAETISKVEEGPLELSTQEAHILQKEKNLIAIAEAKKRAKDEKYAIKAAKKEEKGNEKLVADSISKLELKEQLNANPNKDPDVLVFDVGFEAEQDLLSKKYQKQQAKLAKEFKVEVDNSKVIRSITIEEIIVKESKKTGKFKMGDNVDAITIDKSHFYLSRAIMEIDKGNYKKAVEYSDKSISMNPNYTEAYMLKGDMLASFGYFDKAFYQYEKANMVDSRIPQLHYNMGNCLIYMGKKDKALEQMGVALSIDPNYILAYSGRSSLLIEMKEYRAALSDYNTILEINKYFYPALKGRGLTYLNLGQYQEAVRDFNQLLEYEKEDPSIYYHRGIAKMYLSEIYGACMDFLVSSEKGYAEANKAINKYCD